MPPFAADIAAALGSARARARGTRRLITGFAAQPRRHTAKDADWKRLKPE